MLKDYVSHSIFPPEGFLKTNLTEAYLKEYVIEIKISLY